MIEREQKLVGASRKLLRQGGAHNAAAVAGITA
jgi:hypothetical protein